MVTLNQQMGHKLKVCDLCLVSTIGASHTFPLSAHIRGTYKGRIIEERDVSFEYGEGMEFFFFCLFALCC